MTDERGSAGNRFNKKERLVGQKKTKASSGPNKQNLSRSPRMNRPQKGEKGNVAEGRQSKPSSTCLVPSSGDKGKEKVEGYGMNTKHEHIYRNMVEGQSPEYNGYSGGSVMVHQLVERNLGPEPLDEGD